MQTFASYAIVDEIGHGRYTTVYRARHVPTGREVALKLLDPRITPDSASAKRFLGETRVAANLRHPNIVHIAEYGSQDGVIYLALELCHGGSLIALLDQQLATHRALRIARDVAAALQYAHAHGCIHRDLRPGSILLRENGAAVLCEFVGCQVFGLASDFVERLQSPDHLPYDSPEQLSQQTPDARSDLYCLGVVLYQMLCGTLPHLPHHGGEAIAIAIARLMTDAKPLPTDLAAYQPLVASLLARSPSARPQSAADVVRSLDELIQGTPT